MEIWKQKRYSEYDITTMKKPDSTAVIYLTAVKLSQYKIVSDDRRQK